MKKLLAMFLAAGALCLTSNAAIVYWGVSDIVSATYYNDTFADFSGNGWSASLILASNFDGTLASMDSAIETIANSDWSKNVADGSKLQFQVQKHAVQSSDAALAALIGKEGTFKVIISNGSQYWASDDMQATVYADSFNEQTYESVYPNFTKDAGIKTADLQTFAVPEPTSGLLLLLGMAGLALRRKRA